MRFSAWADPLGAASVKDDEDSFGATEDDVADDGADDEDDAELPVEVDDRKDMRMCVWASTKQDEVQLKFDSKEWVHTGDVTLHI